MVPPARFPLGVPACLSRVITGVRVIGVVVPLASVTGEPGVGGVPETEAPFTTVPASTSAWVIVCRPVQVVLAPPAREVTGQFTAATCGSVTASELRVTLPVLRTRKL